MSAPTTNWAGNVVHRARRVHRPSSLGELQHLVADSERVHALGTGHTFNRIADTSGDLASLAGLPATMEIDSARRVVTVGAGARYGALATYIPSLSADVSAMEIVGADGDLRTVSRDSDPARFLGMAVLSGLVQAGTSARSTRMAAVMVARSKTRHVTTVTTTATANPIQYVAVSPNRVAIAPPSSAPNASPPAARNR